MTNNRFAPKVVARFCESVIGENFDQAYTVLSDRFKQRLSFADFVETLKDAIEDTPVPKRYRCTVTHRDAAAWQDENNVVLHEDTLFVAGLLIKFLAESSDPTYCGCFEMVCAVTEEQGADCIEFFEIMEPDS